MTICMKVKQIGAGRYEAFCPSLPGCVARGDTVDDALDELAGAMRGYLASLHDFLPGRLETNVAVKSAMEA